jgi:hypothetical protein
VLLASSLAFAHSLWFAWRYFQATPWLDMWDWVGEFRAWPDGHFGWRDLIAEHNDHRIATARVLFLIDTLFFHLTGRFITTANMVLLVLLGLLLHRVWRSRMVAGTRADLPGIFFIAVMASVCQWENLVTPFQVQFALLLVFATGATLLLVHGTSAGLPRGRSETLLLGAGLAYGLAAFSMAGGVLLLPVLAGLLVMRRAKLRPGLCFAVPAGFAAFAFFYHYTWHSFGVPLKIAGPSPLLIAYRMAGVGLEFIGSAFGGLGGGAAIAAGAAGLVLFGVLFWRAWRSSRTLAGAEAVFMALAAFVVANAFAAARLRGYFSFWGGLAPRYAALSLVFFVCLAGATVQASCIAAASTGGRAIRATLVPLLAILALAAFNLPVSFTQQAAALQRALQTAGTTLQQGAYAPSRIGILNPFGLDRVIDNVRFAERHRLSVFAVSGRPPARVRAVLRQADLDMMQTCRGAENILYRLDANRAVLRAWLATPNPEQTVRWVALRGDNGQTASVLPAQELRDELPLGPDHAPIMGVFVGFGGALGDGTLTLVGVPDFGLPCRLTVRGPGPVRLQAPPDQHPVQLPVIGPVQASPAWAPAKPGMPATLPALWQDADNRQAGIWTSAAQGDAATGDLTLRVAAPVAGLALAVPFAIGSSPDGQSLMFQAEDGARADLPVPADTPSGQWRLAAIPAAWLAHHPGAVTVTARDQGTGGGQWLAIAAPVAMHLDPDAAQLDHGQPAGGWPVFTLMPPG